MSLLSAPVADNQVKDALSTMGSELTYLLEAANIPEDIIAKIGSIGYTDIDTFAHMESDAKAVRIVLKDDISLDPAVSPAHRAMTARLVAAWETAGRRSAKQKEEEAAQRVGDLPRHLPKGKHLELLRAYQSAHKELKDKECPAPSYLEWRFEQVEDGELKAESFSEVISKEDAIDEDWGGAKVGADGSIKLIKSRSTGKAPENPEQLRAKLRLMGVAWEFVRLKFPARGYLRGLTCTDWTDYTEWLLGEDVYGNVVKDATGSMVYRPSWATLLELDFRVRRRAYHLVNDGAMNLAGALVTAREDTSIFQKYFLTPVALAAGAEAARAAAKRPADPSWTSGSVPPNLRPVEGSQAEPAAFVPPASKGKGKQSKGKGKGKNNKKGGGKQQGGASWRANESTVTPDGRMKCFKFQKGKCPGNCGKVHTCLVCNGKHPVTKCPQRPQLGDAAGSASQF